MLPRSGDVRTSGLHFGVVLVVDMMLKIRFAAMLVVLLLPVRFIMNRKLWAVTG